ncbi:hypothetical protein SRHO_G00275620 [Serrasalmus rhombeus]
MDATEDSRLKTSDAGQRSARREKSHVYSLAPKQLQLQSEPFCHQILHLSSTCTGYSAASHDSSSMSPVGAAALIGSRRLGGLIDVRCEQHADTRGPGSLSGAQGPTMRLGTRVMGYSRPLTGCCRADPGNL